jgi:hypothetical protein
LREVAPHGPWSAALQTALDRALAADAGDRYATAAEFARDVVAAASELAGAHDPTLLINQPVARPAPAAAASTRRIESAERATAPARRRSSHAMAATVGFVLAIAFAGAYALKISWPRAAAPATQPQSQPKSPQLQPQSHPQPQSRPQPQPPHIAPVADTSTPPPTVTARGDRHTPRASPGIEQAGDPIRSSDSGPDSADDPNSLHALAHDVDAHVQRARHSISRGDVQSARAELRDLAPIVGELRRRYGGTEPEQHVEQMMRAGGLQTLRACQDALADPGTADRFPANFRCEQLIPQAMRGESRYSRRRGGIGGAMDRQP